MLKLVFFCRRLGGLTRAAYAERLLAGHVPLALRHHPAMRRYVVNVVEDDETSAFLDSIGELWFDSLDDYRHRLYDSPEGERIITADVRGFLGGADAYAMEEIVHRTPPRQPLGQRTPGLKIVVALGRSERLSRSEFAAHWRDRHVPLVLECPEVRGYATSLVDRPLSSASPALDGFAELWFESEADYARHVARARDPGDPIAADVTRLVGGATVYRVAEYVER